MTATSIRRNLMVWVLGTLGVGAALLVVVVYLLTLQEVDEIMQDSLEQAARMTAGARERADGRESESQLVAVVRRHDGTLLFSSEPGPAPVFRNLPGSSSQLLGDVTWHVYTLDRGDRIVQVAQPALVRHRGAREAALILVGPLLVLIFVVATVMPAALRKALTPLLATEASLQARNAESLAPLATGDMPSEFVPLVQSLNGWLGRIEGSLGAQQRFVADAAHELRSPITALQLQVQILQSAREPQQRAAATEELAAGVARMRRLVEQLLTMSRAIAPDQFHPGPVALGDLAATVLARLRQEAARRGIELVLTARTQVSVPGDEAQLDILLGNLLENALRYVPRGGVVEVMVERDAGGARLRVIDDGPGIPDHERTLVFERFYRSPRALASTEPGSGLGLAIVAAIARRHGAQVSLHTPPRGRGLEVVVSFAG